MSSELFLLYGSESVHLSSSNYMSHLRSFLARPRVLPLNISNPITSSFISFHCLPTECKLYILNMLFHQTPVSYFVIILYSFKDVLDPFIFCRLQKVLDTCTHLGNDSVGNKFYLAQDARVYAAMKNDPETNLSVTLIILFCLNMFISVQFRFEEYDGKTILHEAWGDVRCSFYSSSSL